MKALKFSDILSQNTELGKTLNSEAYPILVLSNTVVHQLIPILEYSLRIEGINAKCVIGEYDNIVQESRNYRNEKLVVVFWEGANLVDGFQYKSNNLSKEQTQEFLDRFKSEIDFVLNNLDKAPLLVINKFSSLIFNQHYLTENNFDYVCEELNVYLKSRAPSNTLIIDIDKIIAKLSIEECVDFRNFYSSKSLYRIGFYKAYSEFVRPAVRSIFGRAKKALIFDCDNTLWNGIVGEDGLDGIALSASTSKGVVYQEVQSLGKELSGKGIILGLSSKNNPKDVDEIFRNHKDMVLGEDDIVIKKVNWEDKIANLQNIANELNIGIDSLVFVDDSDFEINLVNTYLPQVTTIQVPRERYLYPDILRSHFPLFYNKARSKEDVERTKMYKQELIRSIQKTTFENIEDYLQSLRLEVTIYINEEKLVSRIAQLTQKTNQFNLTTKRYTENDIRIFTESKNCKVFACDVRDKFGEFGLTAVAIIIIENEAAIFDTFLLSCRILGRNIELKFMDEVLKHLRIAGIKTVQSSYIKTEKNEQVRDFFDRIGFEMIEENQSNKLYSRNLQNYTFHQLGYIKTTYA